jgi:hypothetical protein
MADSHDDRLDRLEDAVKNLAHAVQEGVGSFREHVKPAVRQFGEHVERFIKTIEEERSKRKGD